MMMGVVLRLLFMCV